MMDNEMSLAALVVVIACQQIGAVEVSKVFGLSEYSLVKDQTWDDAKMTCEENNAHLAVIENEDENEFIHEFLRNHTAKDAWIGLRKQTADPASLRWIDETNFVHGDANYYQPWYRGEPNDESDMCIRMSENGEWRDRGCKQLFWAVCEKKYSCENWEPPTSWTGPCPSVYFNFDTVEDMTLGEGVTSVQTPKSKGLHIAAGKAEQRLGDLDGVSCVKNASSCSGGMAISLVLKNVSGFGSILSTGHAGVLSSVWIENDVIDVSVLLGEPFFELLKFSNPTSGWFRLTIVMSPEFQVTGFLNGVGPDSTEMSFTTMRSEPRGEMKLGWFVESIDITPEFIIDDLLIFDKALTEEEVNALPKPWEE